MKPESNQRKSSFVLISIIFLIITIIVIFFGFRNFQLKKELKNRQIVPYVYQAKDLAKIARENDKNVEIIVNQETGLWDKAADKKIELIPDLVIGGPAETNPNKEFYRPGFVVADNEGNIYVSESLDCLIKKFDNQGNYLFSIGGKGQGPGEIGISFNFTIDEQNIIHVFDRVNQRITRFDSDGRFLTSYRIEEQLPPTYPIFVFANSKYYVSYYDRQKEKVVHVFSDEGKYIKSFGQSLHIEKPLSPGFYETLIDVSRGLLCFSDNRIYFSRLNPYEIHVYDLNGTLLKMIFRKNSFMPPYSIRLLEGGGISYTVQISSQLIGIWQEYIINYVRIPPNMDKKIGGILDVYDLEGQLLTTLKVKETINFSHLDKYGRMYGIRNYYEIPEIVRYALKLK